MAGTVQETTCSSEIVRRSGRRFLERGCILERQIFRDAKMILRDSAALRMTSPHCFVAGGTLGSALNFPFLKEVR